MNKKKVWETSVIAEKSGMYFIPPFMLARVINDKIIDENIATITRASLEKSIKSFKLRFVSEIFIGIGCEAVIEGPIFDENFVRMTRSWYDNENRAGAITRTIKVINIT